MRQTRFQITLACAVVLMSGIATAAEAKPTENQGKTKPGVVELSERGKQLEAAYTKQAQALKADIEKRLPAIDGAKVAAWTAAITAEEAPAKEAAAKAKIAEKMREAPEKLRDLEEALKLGPKTLEDAQEELRRARARGANDSASEKELASAEGFLASRQKEQAQLLDKVEKAKAEVKEAEVALPEATKAAEAAKQAHDKAMAATWQAMDQLGTGGLLSSDKLDGKLAQFMVISDATPRGLAEFAQQGPEHEKLVQQLFDNQELMIQMLIADGPNAGRYGEAMKIYSDIQSASPRAKEGLFQRLAVAVSLSHAVPVVKRIASNCVDSAEGSDDAVAGSPGNSASQHIDPVKRYLSYETWYLAGELQPGFKDLSTWNLALTVNAADPDEALAWGREMLRNLRPDCIPADGNTSVFVDVVDKEIRYGSDEVKNDRPDNAFMQNVLANGGICGRRGFFGTFILLAFGVPAVERVEPGHSTLAHWHPDGWKTRLGADWGKSNRGYYAKMGGRPKIYGADVNLLASSQAREDASAFMRVRRAQWIAALMGEPPKPGLITYSGKTKGPKPPQKGEVVKPTFWNDLALQEQRRIIAGLEAGKRNSQAIPSADAKRPAATGKITVDDKGIITIPSAACSNPTESTKSLYHGGFIDRIVFVRDGTSGDTRLHLSRYSKEGDSFEYTFDAPRPGEYQLVASVVTPKWGQRLFVTANGGIPVEMALPYTIGLWDKSTPIAIELKAGKNVLKFHGPARVTVGHFTLTPLAK